MSDSGPKKTPTEMLSIAALEERVNFIGRALFGSDNFGKIMNQAISAQTAIQRTFSDQMGKGLHLYNMPTQDDLTAVAEQCNRIEERVVRIEMMLTQLVGATGGETAKPVSAVPRTRKPPRAAEDPGTREKKTSDKT